MEKIVIEPSEELDVAAVPALEAQVDDALTLNPKLLILDLSRVTFMDSTGLSALITTKKMCDATDVQLTLRSPGHAVQRLFELTATGPLFNVEP